LYSAGYWSTWHFFPRFRARSTGTFGTEIKGTPIYEASTITWVTGDPFPVSDRDERLHREALMDCGGHFYCVEPNMAFYVR
jgi:hypothetical protein